MKLVYYSIIMLMLFAGCQQNNDQQTSATVNPTEKEAQTTRSIEQATVKPTEKVKQLNESEKLALEYVNVYVNGDDREAAKKFVEDNVHKDSQSAFSIGANKKSIELMITNPKASGHTEIDYKGKTMQLVLITGEGSETIILINDGKVGWQYSPSKNANTQKTYDDMKSKFN